MMMMRMIRMMRMMRMMMMMMVLHAQLVVIAALSLVAGLGGPVAVIVAGNALTRSSTLTCPVATVVRDLSPHQPVLLPVQERDAVALLRCLVPIAFDPAISSTRLGVVGIVISVVSLAPPRHPHFVRPPVALGCAAEGLLLIQNVTPVGVVVAPAALDHAH